MYTLPRSRFNAPDQVKYWNDLELAYDDEMIALETKYFIPYTLVDLYKKLGESPQASKLTGTGLLSFGTSKRKTIDTEVKDFLNDMQRNKNPSRRNLGEIMLKLLEFDINTQSIFDEWITGYFNSEPFRFYTFGVPVVKSRSFDVEGYLASLDIAAYYSDVVNYNLMLIKYYCKNGDKFQANQDSVHLYRAPGVVNRYIIEDGDIIEIDRKIALYSSYVEGLRNVDGRKFFLDGEQVSIEVFATAFEEEYERQSFYFSMEKNGQIEQEMEYYVEKFRSEISEYMDSYPNTLPLKDANKLWALKKEIQKSQND